MFQFDQQEFIPSEMRWDPVGRTWSIIAPERGARPDSFISSQDSRVEFVSDEDSPFSYLNEDATPPAILRVEDSEGKFPWKIKVVPNKYPVLRVEGTIERSGEGLFDKVSGVGAHEIIIEHPTTAVQFGDLSIAEMGEVFKVWRERILDLKKDTRFRYILVFKNHGYLAGATIYHSHSQIVAMPERPLSIQTILNSAREHFNRKERCLFCDIIHYERDAHERVVYDDENFIVLCPYASQHPFELLVLPKTHAATFEGQDDRQLYSLSLVMNDILTRLNKALRKPAFNLAVMTAPPAVTKLTRPDYWSSLEQDFHWHIKITPRITYQAGFEWGSGMFINPVAPETAAKHLRGITVYQ